MPVVDANGIRLHYTERGVGEPLVLLMGLGAAGGAWEEHVRAYERHFRCILVDNRGAGASDKPAGPYTTAMMAADTLGLMDALGIGQAHIAGISMGSAIAQELALAAPGRVRSLTLNCSWLACDTYTRHIFETFRSGYAALPPDEFAKLLHLFIYTPAYHERHGDKLAAARDEALRDAGRGETKGGAGSGQAKGSVGNVQVQMSAGKGQAEGGAASGREQDEARGGAGRMPVHAFQAQCDACLAHDARGRLAAVEAPVLVTVGDRDLFTPPALSLAIARELPHARVELFAGSGHTHHWDATERFNAVTLEFMLADRR